MRDAAPEAGEVRQLGTEFMEGRELLEPRRAGKAAVLLRRAEGRAPEGHDGVADIFVDDPMVAAHRFRHQREIAVDDPHHSRRRHAFAEAGEAPHVAEEHRHLPPVAGAGQPVRLVDQPLDDAGIDIASEGLPDARLGAQLLHHGIEAGREFADLVAGGDGHFGIEGALLHQRRAAHQAAQRTHQVHGDEGGRQGAQHEGQRQKDQTYLDRLRLFVRGHLGGFVEQAPHLEPGLVGLALSSSRWRSSSSIRRFCSAVSPLSRAFSSASSTAS